MSTAPASALPTTPQPATLRMHATGAFGFAFGLTGGAFFLLILTLGSGESNAGIVIPFVLVSLPFTFLGMAVRQVQAVVQNQEDRLVRLERLREERGEGH